MIFLIFRSTYPGHPPGELIPRALGAYPQGQGVSTQNLGAYPQDLGVSALILGAYPQGLGVTAQNLGAYPQGPGSLSLEADGSISET